VAHITKNHLLNRSQEELEALLPMELEEMIVEVELRTKIHMLRCLKAELYHQKAQIKCKTVNRSLVKRHLHITMLQSKVQPRTLSLKGKVIYNKTTMIEVRLISNVK